MRLKKSILSTVITVALASTAQATVNEIEVDNSLLKLKGGNVSAKKTSDVYIVQLKGNPAIAQAQSIGELLPSNQLVGIGKNNYNAMTPAMQAYTKAMTKKHEAVAQEIGSINIIHSYNHTYNGFAAKLSKKQKAQLESHPDVAVVWEDSIEKPTTSNTPAFLGLTGPNGQHTIGNKGEDVIIGVLDTGIVPEHPSFADDGSYSDPSTLGWVGSCDAGEEAEANTFNCNNKLIGARYYKDAFESQYEIQTELGEFISPRDADGHGSHTASTAGGNEGISASLSGIDAGVASGIAPKARVAMYKVCWNSDYENPQGGDEAGCFGSDSMAAIDQAVADGVDVINYSISGSRTNVTTAAAAAKLRATQAGVFVAVSAGNSGPDAETVGTPAPWVTSVAASTYNGTSKIIGKNLNVNTGELAETSFVAVPAGFAPPANLLSGDIVAAEPLEACDDAPLTNGEALNGKVALIARGACAFTEKFINAQNAGAQAVIVYTQSGTTPFAMGGTDPAVAIPGSMISFDDGQALLTSANAETTNVTFSDDAASVDAEEVGNVMASFSSRGPNASSYDIIKPDITAPGVKILAATTNTPMFGTQGELFAYLQGTSMSSPHIAGMAALFKESNPSWSPAQIKSALMTTARQNLTKEDGSTPADPFDFGAGHASPVDAMDPGLLFDTNYADYLAFLCGIDQQAFVEGTGTDCETLTDTGFSTEPSQLNLPSIAIAELGADETVSRTVSNATEVASTYTATIEAPEGINVELQTFDAGGNPIEDNSLTVDPLGNASFALTFSKTDSSAINEWRFGSITWTDNQGHSVRSPIAVKAAPEVRIEVPNTVSASLNRGRLTFNIRALYSGTTSMDFAGLVAPGGIAGNVEQDPGQEFEFLGDGTTFHLFEVPEDTQVLRLSLTDALVDVENADLDLYLYHCSNGCSPVAISAEAASNEQIIMKNPEPAYGDDFYALFVHGYSTGAEESTDYTVLGWIANEKSSSTRAISSKRAIEGRFNRVTISDRSLTPGVYMGGATFYDDGGKSQGTTIIEAVVEE